MSGFQRKYNLRSSKKSEEVESEDKLCMKLLNDALKEGSEENGEKGSEDNSEKGSEAESDDETLVASDDETLVASEDDSDKTICCMEDECLGDGTAGKEHENWVCNGRNDGEGGYCGEWNDDKKPTKICKKCYDEKLPKKLKIFFDDIIFDVGGFCCLECEELWRCYICDDYKYTSSGYGRCYQCVECDKYFCDSDTCNGFENETYRDKVSTYLDKNGNGNLCMECVNDFTKAFPRFWNECEVCENNLCERSIIATILEKNVCLYCEDQV